jgi:hypothetical protein
MCQYFDVIVIFFTVKFRGRNRELNPPRPGRGLAWPGLVSGHQRKAGEGHGRTADDGGSRVTRRFLLDVRQELPRGGPGGCSHLRWALSGASARRPERLDFIAPLAGRTYCTCQRWRVSSPFLIILASGVDRAGKRRQSVVRSRAARCSSLRTWCVRCNQYSALATAVCRVLLRPLILVIWKTCLWGKYSFF